MIFPLLWISAIRSKYANNFQCIEGTWHIMPQCARYSFKKLPILFKQSPIVNDYILEIDPKPLNHKLMFTLELYDKKTSTYIIRNNRRVIQGNISFSFGPLCEVVSKSPFFYNETSYFGSVAGGKGLLTVSPFNQTECTFKIIKELKYSSTKFATTILFGVIAMFIALQSYYGWNKEILFEAPSIPIDEPGNEYEPYVEEEKVKNEDEEEEYDDDFNSEDGF